MQISYPSLFVETKISITYLCQNLNNVQLQSGNTEYYYGAYAEPNSSTTLFRVNTI